jgi:hypothetical protein
MAAQNAQLFGESSLVISVVALVTALSVIGHLLITLFKANLTTALLITRTVKWPSSERAHFHAAMALCLYSARSYASLPMVVLLAQLCSKLYLATSKLVPLTVKCPTGLNTTATRNISPTCTVNQTARLSQLGEVFAPPAVEVVFVPSIVRSLFNHEMEVQRAQCCTRL